MLPLQKRCLRVSFCSNDPKLGRFAKILVLFPELAPISVLHPRCCELTLLGVGRVQQTPAEPCPRFLGGNWCCKAVRRVEHSDLSTQALLLHPGQAPVLSWCHWRAWLGSPRSDIYLFARPSCKKSCLKNFLSSSLQGQEIPDFPHSPNKHDLNATSLMPAEHPSPPAFMGKCYQESIWVFLAPFN